MVQRTGIEQTYFFSSASQSYFCSGISIDWQAELVAADTRTQGYYPLAKFCCLPDNGAWGQVLPELAHQG
jgi:hypothetical protein